MLPEGYGDEAFRGVRAKALRLAGGERSRSTNAELLSVPPEAHEESLIPGTAAAEALEMSSKELRSVGVDWDCDMIQTGGGRSGLLRKVQGTMHTITVRVEALEQLNLP